MIAITGHTDGIGKKLFETLHPNAIGFSRTNGYDITNPNDIFRILDQSKNCKVFINNAYNNFGQSNLLLEAFFRWKDTDKIIINVGSEIAEDGIDLYSNIDLLTYQMHKASLKKLSIDLNNYGSTMQIKYVWFGYVGTEKILAKYPNMPKKMYITVDEAADKILEQIDELYTVK